MTGETSATLQAALESVDKELIDQSLSISKTANNFSEMQSILSKITVGTEEADEQ